MKAVNTSLLNYIFPNINEDGWKFIIIFAVISLITAIIYIPIGIIFLIISIVCFYSFREPIRITPIISDAIIAPADGIIYSISKEKGPDVLGLNKKIFNKISIYTSIFDANINRIPIKSKVIKSFFDYTFVNSYSFDKNDIRNEKMWIHLRNDRNYDFIIKQTSTFCNKRIIDNFKKGDEFLAGEKFGFVRFGLYLDIYIPDKVESLVCVGQRMIAGETIMADLKSDAPRIEGEIR